MENYGDDGQAEVEVEVEAEGSAMYDDKDQNNNPDDYKENEADSSSNEKSPEYSQPNNFSSSESPDSYDSAMVNDSRNGYPSNATDASNQCQDLCNPSTMVTITVTATADGSNPTDAPETDGASPYDGGSASNHGEENASPYGDEDDQYGSVGASPYMIRGSYGRDQNHY